MPVLWRARARACLQRGAGPRRFWDLGMCGLRGRELGVGVCVAGTLAQCRPIADAFSQGPNTTAPPRARPSHPTSTRTRARLPTLADSQRSHPGLQAQPSQFAVAEAPHLGVKGAAQGREGALKLLAHSAWHAYALPSRENDIRSGCTDVGRCDGGLYVR